MLLKFQGGGEGCMKLTSFEHCPMCSHEVPVGYYDVADEDAMARNDENTTEFVGKVCYSDEKYILHVHVLIPALL